MKNKAVFLDKDGTLIDDVPYNVDPQLITLSRHSVHGLKLLQDAGYLLIVISNQAGVAHGYFRESKLTGVSTFLYKLLAQHGVKLNGFYYCPHHPDGIIDKYAYACNCRKPMPGLLFQAADELNIDLSASWMIGDILNDIEAGERAGCGTILIDNGNEIEWVLNEYRIPQKECENIDEAANYILSTAVHERQLEKM